VVKGSWQIEERRENAREGPVTFWLEFTPLTQDLDGRNNPDVVYEKYGWGGYAIRKGTNIHTITALSGRNIMTKAVLEEEIDLGFRWLV